MNTKNMKKYMDEVGMTIVDLHRATNINLATLDAIMDDRQEPTYAQSMNMINKLILHFPKERHWNIFQQIFIEPIFQEKK